MAHILGGAHICIGAVEIPVVDTHRRNIKLVPVAVVNKGRGSAALIGKGLPGRLLGLFRHKGVIKQCLRLFLDDRIGRTNEKFSLIIEQMEISLAAQYRIAAEDFLKNADVVAGRQYTHHLAAFIHRHTVGTELFIVGRGSEIGAGKRPRNTLLSLKGRFHRVDHVLLTLCQGKRLGIVHVASRHDTHAVPGEKRHVYKIIAAVGSLQHRMQPLPVLQIIIGQNGGRRPQTLEVVIDLLQDALFILLRLCLQLHLNRRLHRLIQIVQHAARRHAEGQNHDYNRQGQSVELVLHRCFRHCVHLPTPLEVLCNLFYHHTFF